MKERGRGEEEEEGVGSQRRNERERERERDGHGNIYIECASGALLLHPTRPLFVDCPSFACSVCSHPLPSYSSSSSSVPPCVALRPFIPPTNDASHPQTHQLTLFQSYRTSLPCALSSLPPSFSCPGRVSRFTDLASRSKTRGWYRAAESPVVTYVSLSLSSPSIHPSTIFLFPFSRSLCLFLFSPFRNEKLRRYKHRRRRRRRRSKRR